MTCGAVIVEAMSSSESGSPCRFFPRRTVLPIVM